MGGPISVVTAGARMAEYSPTALLGFIATLSVNLAVLNALPSPALDGGQLVYVLWELLFRKPVPRRVQNALTGLAGLLLVALSLSTIVLDIGRLSDPTSTENNKVQNSAVLPGD